MNFSVLAEAFEKMENTTKRLELTDHLVDLFRATPPETISKIVYLIQGKIRWGIMLANPSAVQPVLL